MAPVYAFDIDGVLCSTRKAHQAELERELGVLLLNGGDYDSFGFWHPDAYVMQRLREVALDLWRRPTVCAAGEASGQEVIRRLTGQNQFAGYVTRRHPDIRADTWTWLERSGFLLGHPERLHHMEGDVESKAAQALKMGATHLVEDSPREAWEAARDGINVVVIRRDYNAEFEQRWQANRAEPFGPDNEIWCRINFVGTLEDLL